MAFGEIKCHIGIAIEADIPDIDGAEAARRTLGAGKITGNDPRAARAVGYAMRHCPEDVPWHRVVNAQGGISLRANVSGMLTQRIRLEQERVVVKRGRVALVRYRWQGPPRSRPLALAALQRL